MAIIPALVTSSLLPPRQVLRYLSSGSVSVSVLLVMATAEVVPHYYRWSHLLLSTLSAILLPTTYHNTANFHVVHLPAFRGINEGK
jgi:hypothetical protein